MSAVWVQFCETPGSPDRPTVVLEVEPAAKWPLTTCHSRGSKVRRAGCKQRESKMGKMRLELRGATASGAVHRGEGELVHHGPYSIVKVEGLGLGWVLWQERRGAGEMAMEGKRFQLVLHYEGQGAYKVEIARSTERPCEGRIHEEMPRDFPEVPSAPVAG